ncbi:MAG: LCP family protein [Treponema sp.]|nr:LCP family protein [Treponema sp.]
MKIIKGDASILLLGLIIILLVLGIVFSIHTFRYDPVANAIAENRVINILFIIEDNKMPLSTYVLMYYPVTKRAVIFDIPGNLGILIGNTRIGRIDSVYDSARINNYEKEIERLLSSPATKIEIDFSLILTKENLVSIVDLLEGVEIFIPIPVSHITDDEIILFPSGMTILDGDKASIYATYRLPHEDSDMEIFRRQRFFLGFLKRQIQMNEMLKNPAATKLYYSFFRTSMNQRSLMRLFDEFVYIDTDRTSIQSVGGNPRDVSGHTLIMPHWDGNLVKDIVRQTLEALKREIEDHLIERTLTVEILNGTTINGLAGRTAEILQSFGYDVISISNADHNNYDSTFIIHRSGDENLVGAFADVIRCTNIRREAIDEPDDDSLILNIEYKADVTLVIGRNFNGRHVVGN